MEFQRAAGTSLENARFTRLRWKQRHPSDRGIASEPARSGKQIAESFFARSADNYGFLRASGVCCKPGFRHLEWAELYFSRSLVCELSGSLLRQPARPHYADCTSWLFARSVAHSRQCDRSVPRADLFAAKYC